MTKTLFIQAISRLILGIVVISILLFLPAGTINYPSAWWFLGLLFVPIAIVGVVLMLKNPSLLAKRLNIKERQTEQRSVVLLSAIMFVFGFISAGFSFRFQWLLFPNKVSYIASAVFLLAYILFLEVMRENVYLSRIVEVQENQKVIDTGLYAFVRHPMYSATFLLFISMPLILGSVISLLIFLIYPFIIAKRIENEEKVLEHELDGYPEYKMKVQYKVIPFIW